VGRNCSLLAGDSVNGCSCGAGPIRCDLARLGKSSKQCSIRTKDGKDLLIVKNAVPLFDRTGEPSGALETFTAVGNLVTLEAPGCAAPRVPGDQFCDLLGRHPAMLELFRMIALVARSRSTVMILGESGSGKERVAEAVHRMSDRASGPFVRVFCSALHADLAESELFGHVKGALAGAMHDRRGRFQEADGGTLLLDEIGDVSPAVQAKLLRVVERGDFERVGESVPISANVRLLCTTQRDLRRLVADGRFRADLYFRLAVFPLRVPPLREHTDDIPFLAGRVLSRLPGKPRLAPEAIEVLHAHAWPGNVRELESVLEYAAVRAEGGVVTREHLPPGLRAAGTPARERGGGRERDRERVVEALEREGGNRTRAAQALGVSRVTLWKRMKRYGLLSTVVGIAQGSAKLLGG
jgi:transcriptional regulator with GAF, ATPase, and Fis domain